MSKLREQLLRVGNIVGVKVTKVTMGKDGLIYVTVSHSEASNYPTFILKPVEGSVLA